MTTINVLSGATINVDATKVNASLANNGTMNLSGATNANNITGSGTTNIKNNMTNTAVIGNKITIASGATLSTAATGIGGNVTSNAGTVELTGTGTLNKSIAGATKISGDVINNGSLQNVTVTGKLISDADKVSGTVANAGTYTVTGGTIDKDVTGGTLNIEGDVTVGNNAEVAVATANVAKGTSLDVGTNTVTLGNTTINGTVKMEITDIAADSSTYTGGKINATSLNLGSNSKLSLTIAPNLIAKKASTGALDIINVSGAITGEFAEMLSNNRYRLTPDESGGFVITNYSSVKEIIQEAGGSGNNISTGVAWDESTFAAGTKASQIQNVLNDLSQHDEHGYVKALTDLAPSDSMVHVGVTQDFNNLIGEQIAARLSREGLNSGDVFEKRGAWMQMLYNHSKQNTTSDNQGFKGNTTGAAFGLDGDVNEQITIGFGYAYGKTDIDSAGRDIDIDGHTIYAYAKYQPSEWYVRGLVNYGFAKYDEKANVAAIANKAKYDVFNYGARAFIGYDLPNGFTPEAGLRLTHIDRRNYTDSIRQHVKSDGIEVMTA